MTSAEETTEVARPLRVLVPLIKEELQAGNHAGLEHYRLAGEMLLEAREQVATGWGAWLTRNFTLSDKTAERYMKLAREAQKPEGRRRPITRLSDVLEPHRATHQPAWQKPVQREAARVNVERMAQDQRAAHRERQLMRELALKLIDIGYKVLATKLHPDKGGSAEGMARLNRVRNQLRDAI